MSKQCEYVGGPRDGDFVRVFPVALGTRICLRSGFYEVATRGGEVTAFWYQKTDEPEPDTSEDWKR